MSAAIGVFQLVPEEGYEWAIPHESDVPVTLDWMKGQTSTVRPRVRLLRVDHHRQLKRASMPWMMKTVLVLRDEAIERVAPILEPFGSFAEAECEDAEIVLFRPEPLPGALGSEESDILWLAPGRALQIRHPRFRAVATEAERVFRVPETAAGAVLLTPGIVQRIRESGASSGTIFASVDAGSTIWSERRSRNV